MDAEAAAALREFLKSPAAPPRVIVERDDGTCVYVSLDENGELVEAVP